MPIDGRLIYDPTRFAPQRHAAQLKLSSDMTPPADSRKSLRFQSIETAQPDAILGLTEAFLSDANPDKMNLTLGVYKDVTGRTPILKCVKEAERRLFDEEDSKNYLLMSGSTEYCGQLGTLVFGDRIDPSRTAILQTPGGTGGLRVAAGFLARPTLAPSSFGFPIPPGPTTARSSRPKAFPWKPITTLPRIEPHSISRR